MDRLQWDHTDCHAQQKCKFGAADCPGESEGNHMTEPLISSTPDFIREEQEKEFREFLQWKEEQAKKQTTAGGSGTSSEEGGSEPAPQQ